MISRTAVAQDVQTGDGTTTAVLFCGDPIAFVSRHHFPACMHRPDALEMARQAPKTRYSTPFFLYADDEAILDQAALEPGHAQLVEVPRPRRRQGQGPVRRGIQGVRLTWLQGEDIEP